MTQLLAATSKEGAFKAKKENKQVTAKKKKKTWLIVNIVWKSERESKKAISSPDLHIVTIWNRVSGKSQKYI